MILPVLLLPKHLDGNWHGKPAILHPNREDEATLLLLSEAQNWKVATDPHLGYPRRRNDSTCATAEMGAALQFQTQLLNLPMTSHRRVTPLLGHEGSSSFCALAAAHKSGPWAREGDSRLTKHWWHSGNPVGFCMVPPYAHFLCGGTNSLAFSEL